MSPRWHFRRSLAPVALLAAGLAALVIGLLIRPPSDAVLRAAEVAYAARDYQRAAELYGQAVQQSSDTGRAVFNRAAALYELQADADAAADFDQARQDAPADRRARAAYNRGNCLLRLACRAAPEASPHLLRQAIAEYDACLRLLADRNPSLADDARHNRELARRLLEEAKGDDASASSERPSPESASQDRPGEDAAARPRPEKPDQAANDSSKKDGQKKTCPVCGNEYSECDKECSSCKSCQGKQGNNPSPSGKGTQPNPGEGQGAGKEGGKQPLPSGAKGTQGQTGRQPGNDGAKPSPQSSNQPGGVPGESQGQARPGKVATRNRPDDRGGIGKETTPQRTPTREGPGPTAEPTSDGPGRSQDAEQSTEGATGPQTGPFASATVAAPAAARELVEVFFQPDPESSRKPAASTAPHTGRASPSQSRERHGSASSQQAEKQLRSAIERIEGMRKQRAKLNQVWRDHPEATRNFKDW